MRLLLVFMLIGVHDLLAQDQSIILIKGKVTSAEDGDILPGVNIKVKGSPGATTTGVDGTFSIRVAKGTTLIFSYIGFTTREVKVLNNNNNLNIALKVNASNLQEIVVTGYGGTSTSLDRVGSISQVKNAEFKNTTVNTVDQILQGRVAGVNVISTSGEPGADISVNIRGVNSISGDNQPLYVIDGFPVPENSAAPTSGIYGGNQQNGLFGLNPNDIESIDVLKDASATAIYGSRGANGVVLITTKKGKSGESTVELTNKTGVGFISSPYQMMNSQQFVDVQNQRSLNANQLAVFDVEDFAKRTNTNWLKQITRTSVRQETGFNIRGGAGANTYFLSGSYLHDKGLLINSGNNRGNVRFNLNSNVKKWLTIRGNFAATQQKTAIGITNNRGWPGSGGPILNSLRQAPLFDNNLDDGELDNVVDGVALGSPTFINPVLEQSIKIDNSYNQQIIANIESIFSLNAKKNYELHLVTGTSGTNSERQILLPPIIDKIRNGSAQIGKSETRGVNLSMFLIQKMKLFGQSLNNTYGVEYVQTTNTNSNSFTSDLDYPDLALYNLGSGKVQTAASGRGESSIQSAFFRTTYNYKNRYVFSGSIRADGSSRFAKNKKYGYFPSGGFTWNISEEKWVKDNIKAVDLAKIRVSYGATGNDRSLPINRSVRLYGTNFAEFGNFQGATPSVTLGVIQPNNPNLVWESNKQFNIATDLGFFKNKLSLSFEYYNKLTENLLQNVPFASQGGFGRVWANVGTIRNRGIELNLTTNQINKKNFTWGTNLNLSRYKTILVNLGDFDPLANIANVGGNLTASGASHLLVPGQELGLFYGYKLDGLYQPSDFNPDGSVKAGVPVLQGNTADTRVGRVKFANTDGSADNLVTPEDRTIIGNAAPDLILGFTNNFRYKKLSLSFLFTGTLGNDIQNVVAAYARSGNVQHQGLTFNQTQDWYNKRWTYDNQHNDARYPAVQTSITITTPDATSAMIEDGSYLRCKNVTLSYQFDVKKINFLRSLNVYVTGTDLFNITKYSGFDPEVSSFGANPLLMGIDYGSYPRNRNFTLGLTVGL
ncbi:TonB-dependent receptor [Pelobium sp.]|nr:TonB-dependent receptor [Pelobium sp.]MDA9555462.1 TonB-dependent receptor [Pelobium sp.]